MAKARCNFQEANAARHLCDRCEKMGIKCVAKATRSLRKPRQIKPLNSRLSTLERQLETLTAALEIHQGSASRATESTSPAAPPNIEQTAATLTPDSTATNNSRDVPSLHQQPEGRHQGAQPSRTKQPDSVPVFGLTWPQVERILDIFRAKYMPKFPFVIVQQHTTARTLFEQKPFLFRAIMLAAAPLPASRLIKMKRNVLAYLGQHMLVEEERKLDLLQGLLVCLAWADLRSLYDEQITTLTYLALGYAHNLGITRMPPALLRMIGMDEAPEDVRQSKHDAMMQQNMHSTEEQRAYLGCYCLLSVNSTQFGRQNALRSQYIDLCGDALKRKLQHPLDGFLERMVRLTQMGERISEAFGAANDSERGKPFLFLLEDQTTAFKAELDAVIDSLAQELTRDRMSYAHGVGGRDFDSWEKAAALHYNYLLVRLYEPATRLPELPADDGQGYLTATYRAQCLDSCLGAAKAYFDTLFTLPAAHYVHQSVANTEQVTFVMVIATRLLLLRSPGWDLGRARSTLDFVAVLDHLLRRVEDAEAERRRDVEAFVREMGVRASEEEVAAEGPLVDTVKKVRWIRAWFEKRVQGEQSAASAPGDDDDVEEIVVNREEPPERIVEQARFLAMGGGSYWFGGLLPNTAWNFDDVNM
ncbi:fungal transcriptional regulatory protein [Purpureocillium lavendulum]|uniref:Fungal transcriptional regulatory protein n=1 Tax=Purpureocillium lavendulum TaxID=1247861 RepID=A0AB34FW77_9HYPO|nr:fungal transcriptional regulatory protein [Purpureocillium lavendulum]